MRDVKIRHFKADGTEVDKISDLTVNPAENAQFYAILTKIARRQADGTNEDPAKQERVA